MTTDGRASQQAGTSRKIFNSKVFEDIKSSKIFKNSKVKNLMSRFIYLEDRENSKLSGLDEIGS